MANGNANPSTDLAAVQTLIPHLRAMAAADDPALMVAEDESIIEYCGHAATALASLLSDLSTLQQALRDEELAHALTIDQRDGAQDAADKLAYAIAGVDTIGEHSNLNDPWQNALEALEAERDKAEQALSDEHKTTLALSSELSGVRRVLEILDGETVATADVARNLVEQYKGQCATLRVTANKHQLGLGGEQLDALVCDALDKAEQAPREAERERDALSAREAASRREERERCVADLEEHADFVRRVHADQREENYYRAAAAYLRGRAVPDAAPASCCEWREDEAGYWLSSCNRTSPPNTWPTVGNYGFCGHCSRPLKAIPYQPDPVPSQPGADQTGERTK